MSHIWLIISILADSVLILVFLKKVLDQAADVVDSFTNLLKSIKKAKDAFHDLWKHRK